MEPRLVAHQLSWPSGLEGEAIRFLTNRGMPASRWHCQSLFDGLALACTN